MKRLLFALTLGLPLVSAAQPVFINEIHYDNAGTDAGEAIEIAGPAGTDLTGWSIVLYNGSNGSSYGTTVLDAVVLEETCPKFGVTVVEYPPNGIQNGSPDGIALANSFGEVVQYLSYEGTFVAVGGPADGLMSTDIGVAQSGADSGTSLQLVGTAVDYAGFSWVVGQSSSFGECNQGQIFSDGILAYLRDDGETEHPTGVTINEIAAWPGIDFNADGTADDADEFVELVNTSDTPIDVNGWMLADDTDASLLSGLDPIGPTHALVVFTRGADVSNFDPGPGNQVTSVPGLALDDANDLLGLRNADDVFVLMIWGDPENIPAGLMEGAQWAGYGVPIEGEWVQGQSWTRIPDNTGMWGPHQALDGTCNWSVSGDPAFDMSCPNASPARSGADGTVLATDLFELPDRAILAAAYPNPFNPSTTIGYALPEATDVRLAVFDLTGREVAVLVQGVQSAGSHEVRFEARDLATGVYLVRMQAGRDVQTRALVLVR